MIDINKLLKINDYISGVDYARGEGATESSDDEVTQADYVSREGVVESSSDDDFVTGGDHARGEGVMESSDDDEEEEEGIELLPLRTIQVRNLTGSNF